MVAGTDGAVVLREASKEDCHRSSYNLKSRLADSQVSYARVAQAPKAVPFDPVEKYKQNLVPISARDQWSGGHSRGFLRLQQLPRRKLQTTKGVAREEPKHRLATLSAKPAPAKADANPRKVAGKDKSSDKKVQTKGKRGAKGKQAEVTNEETKEDLPAENGETKNEESPASVEAEEKEVKSD
ncbi:non-histone chromosomal protein HMG-14-like [Sciurus carolinensis]|uniref:non-histone chromosomal protein HMG-14-like n=1 Tax=Sciurus carolinensis TaxID=30640 RepID=UPI001FB2D571|nr:non-histone chromosomal protein HMG-14-like [Sciurus carolinensis]